MNDKYVLEGHDAVPETDLITWARWFETADRKVALTDIAAGVNVSTVFLGLDHGYGDGPPQIFETMVFGGPLDKEMDRYATWDEALKGHTAMVKRATDA